MKPLVTVVLPTYNRARTATRAIESVLRQSRTDLELIVVDDGSTDETATLVGRIEDPRLRYLRFPERRGAAAARNAGVRAGLGDVIAFQDSDDEWLPNKLAVQVKVIEERSDVGWVGGKHLAITPQGEREISPQAVIAGRDHRLEILDGSAFVTPTWLVRRTLFDALGGFREDMPCLEDWDLILRLDERTRFAATEQIILRRHASRDSLFGDSERRLIGLRIILQSHSSKWVGHPAELAGRYREMGDLALDSGCRRMALAAFCHAVRLEPRRLRSYSPVLRHLIGARLHKALSRSLGSRDS